MHRQSLYLGLDPGDEPCVHYPVIRVVPRPLDNPEIKQAFDDLPLYTHVIFTSKQTIEHFPFEWAALKNKILIAIGSATAIKLKEKGFECITPKHSTQEGLIDLLEKMTIPQDAYFFYPRSALARPMLADFLHAKGYQVWLLDLYDTHYQRLEPVPDLAQFDRIIFSSPSTVRGFLRIFGTLPKDKELVAIGPVTAAVLSEFEMSP